MNHEEIWIKDGYLTGTGTNVLLDFPVSQGHRLSRLNPLLTRRKVYFGITSPGTVIDAIRFNLIFRRLGSEVGRLQSRWLGSAAGTAPALSDSSYAASLPYTVVFGGTRFDYPPASGPDVRIIPQSVWPSGGPYEALIMYPTTLNIEADEMEFAGQISLESATTQPIYAVAGVVSEAP